MLESAFRKMTAMCCEGESDTSRCDCAPIEAILRGFAQGLGGASFTDLQRNELIGELEYEGMTLSESEIAAMSDQQLAQAVLDVWYKEEAA